MIGEIVAYALLTMIVLTAMTAVFFLAGDDQYNEN